MSKSGIILIVVGVFLLAHNFGLLPWGWLRQWWPLGLIALGVWSIASPQHGDNDQRGRTDRERLP